MNSGTPAIAFGSAVQTAGSCWTIDATSKAAGGSDNGFLDCARAHTPGYRSHSSTGQAVGNLTACIAAGPGIANVVGHGNDGLIVTGQGQTPSDPQKFITIWNEYIWGPIIRALRGKATIIKLWACHPGTAQAGADLLYAMMQETNATCMGPTGFLYCGGAGFFLEPNSTWQVSSPGRPKPNPIAAPTHHFVVPQHMWKFEIGAGQVIDLTRIKRIEVRRDGQPMIRLREEAAKGFVSLIDFAHPLQIAGVPGAIVTGELVLTYADSSDAEREETFVIYNNRMVVRDADPPVYFNCSEGFANAIMVGVR
jgi:hypothetical protein